MSEEAVPNPERSQDVLKAYNLLAQGKRNMICREYNTAVNQYQEACELLVKWFGEMGKELAEPYFRYGSALLELARAESGVFGSAMPGMEDEDEDEEDEADSSEDQGEKTSDENEDGESATTKENSADESASQEGSTSAEEKDKKEEEKTDGEKKVDEKKEEDAKKVDEKTEGDAKKEASKTDDAQAGCSKDENGKEEEEEDESSLKLAWEILELAKVIFLRSEEKADQLRAGECYIKLGEIGLESDTVEGAIQDFKSSLEIQQKHVEPHSRILAETYYQLGMAYGIAGDMENSADSYRKAAKCVSTKIEVLEKMTESAAADKGKAPASIDDPIANAQDELKELKELLPDILAKVEEAEAEAKSSKEAVRKIAAMAFGLEDAAQGNNPFAAFAASSSTGFGSSSSGFGSSSSGFGSSSSGFGSSASTFSSTSTSQPKASGTSEAAPATINNISHLVRKKRKQEGEDGDSGVEVKRTRSENGTGEAAACEGSQRQQEQGSGDSAATTTEKQTTSAPVAAVSGESA